MQEIFERRFRWTVRQVLAAAAETRTVADAERPRSGEARARQAEVRQRLEQLERFFSFSDSGIGAFVQGEPFHSESLRNVVPLPARRAGR